MKKIEKLTDAQIALFPKYRDEGIAVGLDTNDNYDLEQVKGLINEVRSFSKEKLPKVKNWIEIDSPFAACRDIEGITPANALFGAHDIHWLQYYNYFRNECGLVKETENIVALRELCNHIGWFWFSEDTVVITRKPNYLGLSSRKADWGDMPIVHDTERQAIQYRDGTGLYCLDNMVLPDDMTWLITDKSRVTPENILAIKNVDIRNAALKLLGPKGLIGALPHDILDTATISTAHTPTGKLDIRYLDILDITGSNYRQVESHYKLIGFELNGIYRKYLQGICPSKGEEFTEAVPPECDSVYSALNYRETGVVDSNYQPPLART